MNAKDKAMIELIWIVLGEYPEEDDRYQTALKFGKKFFPDETHSYLVAYGKVV